MRTIQSSLGLNGVLFKPFFILPKVFLALLMVGIFPHIGQTQVPEINEVVIPGEHTDMVSRYGAPRVAINDRFMVLGDIYDAENGFHSGSVRVYINREGQWEFLTKVLSPVGSSYDYYGFAVALNGDYLFTVHGDYNSRTVTRRMLVHQLSDSGAELVATHFFDTLSSLYFSQKIHAHQDLVMVNRYAANFKDNFMLYRMVDGDWVFETEITEDMLVASSNVRSASVYVMSIEDDGITFVVNELTTDNESIYFLKKMSANSNGQWDLIHQQVLGFGGIIEFDESKGVMCMTHRLGNDTAAKVLIRDDETGMWMQRLDWIKRDTDDEHLGGCAVINDGNQVVVHSYHSDGAFVPTFDLRTLNLFEITNDDVVFSSSLVNERESNGHTYLPLASDSDGRYLAYVMADIYVLNMGQPSVLLNISGQGYGNVIVQENICHVRDNSCSWEVPSGVVTMLFDPMEGHGVQSFTASSKVEEILYDNKGAITGLKLNLEEDASVDVVFKELLPDLVIGEVVHDKMSHQVRAPVNISIEVHNQGDGLAEASRLELYRTYKEKFLEKKHHNSYSKTMYLNVPALQPGETVVLETQLRSMPFKGDIYLNLMVDAEDRVKESDEGNNQAFRTFDNKRSFKKYLKKYMKKYIKKYKGKNR